MKGRSTLFNVFYFIPKNVNKFWAAVGCTKPAVRSFRNKFPFLISGSSGPMPGAMPCATTGLAVGLTAGATAVAEVPELAAGVTAEVQSIMNILVLKDQKLYEKKILNFFTWLWEGAKDSLKAAGAEDGGGGRRSAYGLPAPPLVVPGKVAGYSSGLCTGHGT